MIERATIDGRQATVAYFKAAFEPTTREDATAVKVLFDDGEVRFGYRALASPVQPTVGEVK